MTIRVSGAGVPGLEAAVLISEVGPEVVRSAVAFEIQPDALIPAHDHSLPLSVVAGVVVGGAVTSPHSYQHQQQDFCGQIPHIRHFLE